MSREIFIFGTGAHARKVFQCAVQSGYRVPAFVDENPAATSPVAGVPVLCGADMSAMQPSGAGMFVAIGRPDVRRRMMACLAAAGWAFPALIHPRAYVAPDAVIADGVLVAAGAVVETGTIVDRGAIVDVGVIIDHDCHIGEFCHLHPGRVCPPGTEIVAGAAVS
ncbi:MAG: hypothetical protein HZA24_12505 [Nitrospirae bacterium]|nr:hypothetical protein [Nitrospirota bacterium]